MADPNSLLIRVFTHPACPGCSKMVDKAWKLSRARSNLDLRTVNLVNEHGLAEARSEGIKTIPTVILSSAAGDELGRWVGNSENGALEVAVDELTLGVLGAA